MHIQVTGWLQSDTQQQSIILKLLFITCMHAHCKQPLVPYVA